MKTNKAISAMGLCLCILIVGMTGCSTLPASTPDTVELEPYYENDAKEESVYENLTLVELGDERLSIKTYLPMNEKITQDETSVTSEKDGISVALSLLEETKEQSVGNIMEEIYKKEKNRIAKLNNVQDFKVYDLMEYDGYWMLEMDYNLHDGNGTLYPCISIIKLDVLDDGFLLASVIQVDNSKANKNTSAVLKEILEVYGIHMK